MARFSIGESFDFGWDIMKRHFGFFFLVLLIVFLFNLAMQPLVAPHPDGTPTVPLIARILYTVAMAIIDMGLIRIAIRFVDQLENRLGELFACLPLTISYIVGGILFSLLLALGLILFVIPGIYVGIRLHFYKYFIVDKGMGPIEALQASWDLTKGEFLNLLGLVILLFLANFLGVLCLGVGLFVSLPTTMVAHAAAYRKLESTT